MNGAIETLTSRKFWLGIILVPVLVVLNRKLGMGLTAADLGVVVASVGAWILGEAHIDAKAIGEGVRSLEAAEKKNEPGKEGTE